MKVLRNCFKVFLVSSIMLSFCTLTYGQKKGERIIIDDLNLKILYKYKKEERLISMISNEKIDTIWAWSEPEFKFIDAFLSSDKKKFSVIFINSLWNIDISIFEKDEKGWTKILQKPILSPYDEKAKAGRKSELIANNIVRNTYFTMKYKEELIFINELEEIEYYILYHKSNGKPRLKRND